MAVAIHEQSRAAAAAVAVAGGDPLTASKLAGVTARQPAAPDVSRWRVTLLARGLLQRRVTMTNARRRERPREIGTQRV